MGTKSLNDWTERVMPTREQLEALDRDLGFRPCGVNDPTILTPDGQNEGVRGELDYRRPA